MKVFLAGATGAIGRRLLPLLRAAGHDVVGTTRRAERCDLLRRLGALNDAEMGLVRAAMAKRFAI